MDPNSIAATARLESTATLLRRIRGGDGPARERLCARYLPLLRRWAHGRLPGHARDLLDTQDLVQITLLRVLDALDRFEPQHEGAFLCYLRETLLNAVRGEIRRVGRRGGAAADLDDLAGADAPVARAVGADQLAEYERALARLPVEHQQAVLLRIEFGFSFAEIAAALEKPSANAARMAVSRALKALAEALAD